MGVWNGWGYGIAFFRALNFKFRSLKFGKNRSACGISGIFLENSASEKYFSDSGQWPFHTPPIHTPTKCQPSIRPVSEKNGSDGSGSDFGSWKTVPAVPVCSG